MERRLFFVAALLLANPLSAQIFNVEKVRLESFAQNQYDQARGLELRLLAGALP